MKPFHFSLDAVRTLRQRQERQALEAFGTAVRDRQAAIDQQQQAERRLAVALDQLTALQSEGAPVYELNQLRNLGQGLEAALVDRRQDCARAQDAANAAWDRLQDVRRELELVEKLYLRQREQHERELRAEEQKFLDEISGRRWVAGALQTRPTALAWN